MAGRASVRAWNVVVLQDDKDLVHEFVNNDGLECLIKVGSEADQNYQNYILRGAYVRYYCLLVPSARPDSAGTITNSWVLFLLCGVRVCVIRYISCHSRLEADVCRKVQAIYGLDFSLKWFTAV